MKLFVLLGALCIAVAADEMWGRYGYGSRYPMYGGGWGMSWGYPGGGYWNSWRYPMYGGGAWDMQYPMYGGWDSDWS